MTISYSDGFLGSVPFLPNEDLVFFPLISVSVLISIFSTLLRASRWPRLSLVDWRWPCLEFWERVSFRYDFGTRIALMLRDCLIYFSLCYKILKWYGAAMIPWSISAWYCSFSLKICSFSLRCNSTAFVFYFFFTVYFWSSSYILCRRLSRFDLFSISNDCLRAEYFSLLSSYFLIFSYNSSFFFY